MRTLSTIKQAVKTIKSTLKTSLGPNGYNKIINVNDSIFVTNDGVTIIKNLTTYNDDINSIIKIISDAAITTDLQVGDGTTSTALIACEIYLRAVKHKIKNLSLYIKGIEDTVMDAMQLLDEMSRKDLQPKEILQIATYATNDQLGKIIYDAYQQIAFNGHVEVMETHNISTEYAIHNDFRFNAKPHSYLFLDEIGNRELEQPLVVILDCPLINIKQIELALQFNRPLLIVCDMIGNKMLEKLVSLGNVVAIKPIEQEQNRINFLNDLKVYTNANIVLDNVTYDDIGSSKSMKILNNEVIISPSPENKKNIEEHVNKLKHMLFNTTNQYHKLLLQNRIERIDSSTILILLGATTNQEMINNRYKVTDGINAVKTALATGVVSGRGVSYKIIYEVLIKRKSKFKNKQYQKGKKDFLYAILVIFKILEYNRSSKRGNIIDPVGVAKCVLHNASSIAKLLISSDGIINKRFERDIFE